jgi:hypothetical protein
MKRKLIGLTLTIFILTGMNVFGQVMWCDIDFGCPLVDNWRPTIPRQGNVDSGGCHAVTPDFIKGYARSQWDDGSDCPVAWIITLENPSYNTDDCYINGCHQHQRILNPSQYQKMLTSSGGLRPEGGTISSSFYKLDIAYFAFDIAKPEASGVLKVVFKSSIPENCDRSRLLLYNPGWQLDPDDPYHWMYTKVELPYHILELVELPDGDNYLKSSTLNNHVNHQFYARQEMRTRLQQLAEDIRTVYRREYGWNVRISFNDLSLEYGGIMDYQTHWGCPHKLHRLGRSADLNVGERDSTAPLCLQCDSVQDKPNCESKYSTDFIEITDRATGQTRTLTVKRWIDEMAGGHNLHEEEPAENRLIHLEMD